MTVDVTENMNHDERTIFEQYAGSFPFPVVDFANALGLKVFVDKMPSHQSGAISKNDGDYVVCLNEDHPTSRMRFTLAHELSHYFNDRSYLEEKRKIVDSSTQSQRKWLFRQNGSQDDLKLREMDVKANQFAAELLMPQRQFIEVWHEKISPRDVASFFNVSLDAVKVRAAILLGEIV